LVKLTPWAIFWDSELISINRPQNFCIEYDFDYEIDVRNKLLIAKVMQIQNAIVSEVRNSVYKLIEKVRHSSGPSLGTAFCIIISGWSWFKN